VYNLFVTFVFCGFYAGLIELSTAWAQSGYFLVRRLIVRHPVPLGFFVDSHTSNSPYYYYEFNLSIYRYSYMGKIRI